MLIFLLYIILIPIVLLTIPFWLAIGSVLLVIGFIAALVLSIFGMLAISLIGWAWWLLIAIAVGCFVNGRRTKKIKVA